MFSRNLASCLHFVFTSILICVASKSSFGEEVYFRSDRGLPRGTEASGPDDDGFDFTQPKWKCSLAPGHSTPTVLGDKIALTTFDDVEQPGAEGGKLSVVVVDRGSGDIVWQRSIKPQQIEPFHRAGSPAVATIAADGERLYAFFGSYGLLCYDLAGNLIWEQPMGPFQDEFGAASSPVLAGELVILNQDHDHDNALTAFNKRTGELTWRVKRDEFTRSYSTPVVATVDGRKQLIVAGSLTLTGYDAATGERLWWVDGLARIVNPTPLIFEDVAYVATWAPGGDASQRVAMDRWADAQRDYDQNGDNKIQREELLPGPVLQRFFRMDIDQDGGLDQTEWEKHAAVFERAQNSLHAIQLGGQGDLTGQIRWSQNRGLPFVASPVLHRGSIFMVKDGGIVTAVASEDGALQRRGRLKATSTYYASPIASGKHVYIASVSGLMSELTAEANWKVTKTHDFEASIYATPVAIDGQLFVRTNDALYRFDR